jgi:hypothetical protein
MVHEIFENGDFPDESVEERHFYNGCMSGFTTVGENQHRFSMIRHPSFGPHQDRKTGLSAFTEVENFFILDTENKTIAKDGSKVLRVVVDYDRLAEDETEDLWFNPQLEKIPTREKAIEFIESEAEKINWKGAIEDGIRDVELMKLDFRFDWNRYLSTVKKLFKERMIEKWEDSDHLKLV